MTSGLIVILIAGVARYADYYLSVAPPQYDNGGDWWYQKNVRLGVFWPEAEEMRCLALRGALVSAGRRRPRRR
jgi:hypothetical protein